MTLRIGFDQTQCACAHDMSNRLIDMSVRRGLNDFPLEDRPKALNCWHEHWTKLLNKFTVSIYFTVLKVILTVPTVS